MRNSTTNSLNLFILSLFVVSPLIGYFSLTYLHRGFSTVVMPVVMLGVVLVLFLRKELIFTKSFMALFFFALYTIISDGVLVHKDFNASYFISNELIGSVLIFFIIDNTLPEENYMRKIFTISSIILFIAFLVSIIQQFKDITFLVAPSEIHSLLSLPPWETRLPSIYTWIGPLWMLGHCFFPVLSVVIAQQLKQQKKYVWIYYIMGLIVAFLSKSRFIMLNFLLLFLLIPIYQKLELKAITRYVLITAIAIGGIMVTANVLNFNIGNIVEKRLLETDKGGITKGAAGTRILAFNIFGKLFGENPLFGKGKLHDFTPNSKDQELVRALAGRSSQIHVGFLSLFYYYGIAGGLLFMIFLIYCTKGLYDSARIHHYWGPFFGFIQLFLSNLTNVTLHVFIMGYIICFMFDKYYLNLTQQHYESQGDL